MDRKITLRVMEDNEAAIRVIVTGHNPNMRHMSRTQRIDVSALNERYHAEDFRFVTCPSQFEAGDILTKACTDSRVWSRNLMSIGHFRKGTLISSGMINAVPALSGSVVSPEGPCPTRGYTSHTGPCANHLTKLCRIALRMKLKFPRFPVMKVSKLLCHFLILEETIMDVDLEMSES